MPPPSQTPRNQEEPQSMDQQQHQQSAPSQIAFFDVETTIPSRTGAGYSLLEFGAIVVCPRRLVELGSYSTLISPSGPNSISASSVRCNGITKDTVSNAPSFRDVADQIFNILHGRVWAGHNIVRFDCARIREAFAEIGMSAPEAKGMVDTLPLLTQRFGRRAGDMKMASLATYFGLGHQKHRSLDDVRMNLEVLKYCSTVLFLLKMDRNRNPYYRGKRVAHKSNVIGLLASPIKKKSDTPVSPYTEEYSHAYISPKSTASSHSPTTLRALILQYTHQL